MKDSIVESSCHIIFVHMFFTHMQHLFTLPVSLPLVEKSISKIILVLENYIYLTGRSNYIQWRDDLVIKALGLQPCDDDACSFDSIWICRYEFDRQLCKVVLITIGLNGAKISDQLVVVLVESSQYRTLIIFHIKYN